MERDTVKSRNNQEKHARLGGTAGLNLSTNFLDSLSLYKRFMIMLNIGCVGESKLTRSSSVI